MIFSYNSTDVIIEHISGGFNQNMVVFIFKSNKNACDYLHHATNVPTDGVAKPTQRYHLVTSLFFIICCHYIQRKVSVMSSNQNYIYFLGFFDFNEFYNDSIFFLFHWNGKVTKIAPQL